MSDGSLIIRHETLRRALGILGIFLPFILAIGGLIVFGEELQESISDYYHTGMGDVFVGVLFAIGIFLFAYKGHERQDDVFGDLACLFAIVVALFPTAPSENPTPTELVVGRVHWIFSALLFLVFAYFSLVLFVKTDQENPAPRKLTRNRIYRICGVTILVAIALIALEAVLPQTTQQWLSTIRAVFWLEAVAVVAFGVSWLVKGEALLRD